MSDGLDRFARLVAARGVAARPHHELVRLLAGEGVEVDDLVRRTGLPRRAVEEALAVLGDDVVDDGGFLRLRPEVAAAYAGRFPAPPAGGPPAERVARLDELVRRAPRPKRDLDHVAATAETAARRADLLTRTYALAGRRVLLVGDHDLTALALALAEPAVELAVVDIDDDVLAYIAAQPEAAGRIRCLFADLRAGLPGAVREWADLAVTDPPYTPAGVGLFVRRALEGLASLDAGRLALAYGYGDQPGLGLKVQDALRDLRLVYEAVLPGFNRYVGAQAIGSTSNLYLLRPTSGTRRVLGRLPAPRRVNVYTHGTQALEGGPGPLPPPSRAALAAAAGEGTEIDLRHDTGPLLLRALIAGGGDRLAVLVPNRHPDIAGAAGQVALRALVGARWDLRYRRSDPGPHLAIVEATAAHVPVGDVGARARRHVLDRPEGRLANVGREALIAATIGRRVLPLTKNAARAVLADALAGADLDACLLDLPRGAMAGVLDGLAAAAEDLVDGR
jgi:hypothetical protein